MSRRPALMTSLLVLCATLGLACASGLAGVPAAASLRVNPFEGDPNAVRAGHKLFQRHCAECHGDDGQGRGKAPSLVSDRVQGAASGELFWFLTNGDLGAGMPGWSRLPDARRWQLVAFLKSLSDPRSPAPDEPHHPAQKGPSPKSQSR